MCLSVGGSRSWKTLPSTWLRGLGKLVSFAATALISLIRQSFLDFLQMFFRTVPIKEMYYSVTHHHWLILILLTQEKSDDWCSCGPMRRTRFARSRLGHMTHPAGPHQSLHFLCHQPSAWYARLIRRENPVKSSQIPGGTEKHWQRNKQEAHKHGSLNNRSRLPDSAG